MSCPLSRATRRVRSVPSPVMGGKEEWGGRGATRGVKNGEKIEGGDGEDEAGGGADDEQDTSVKPPTGEKPGGDPGGKPGGKPGGQPVARVLDGKRAVPPSCFNTALLTVIPEC